jgi:hypothetical protein
MLSKFTVLACYCIYFSDSAQEYSHMFMNVAKTYRTDLDTDEQIIDASVTALKLMQPNWKPKGLSPVVVDKELIKKLKNDLRQAEDDYKNAEWAGGQLYMKICKDKIEKLRKQIEEENGKEI